METSETERDQCNRRRPVRPVQPKGDRAIIATTYDTRMVGGWVHSHTVKGADGGGVTNLTNSDSVSERYPSVSPIPIE